VKIESPLRRALREVGNDGRKLRSSFGWGKAVDIDLHALRPNPWVESRYGSLGYTVKGLNKTSSLGDPNGRRE